MVPECRCAENQTCTDLIVSDLNMPNMTGLRFIQNQRKKNCKCKHVAMISADWTDEDLALARQLGCKIFTKPLFFDDLTNGWIAGNTVSIRKRAVLLVSGTRCPAAALRLGTL